MNFIFFMRFLNIMNLAIGTFKKYMKFLFINFMPYVFLKQKSNNNLLIY